MQSSLILGLSCHTITPITKDNVTLGGYITYLHRDPILRKVNLVSFIH
jgi:hypothetical protein